MPVSIHRVAEFMEVVQKRKNSLNVSEPNCCFTLKKKDFHGSVNIIQLYVRTEREDKCHQKHVILLVILKP